jgi:membrane-associated HD superfamily phosphohydrolase
MNTDREESPGRLITAGLVLGAIPVLCLFILIISTGHSIQPGIEEIIFGLVFYGFLSGILTLPMGVALVVFGIKKWVNSGP